MLGAQSVPRSTATSAETTAPLAAIAASTSPLVDQTHFRFVDISYSGSVHFLLHKAYTPDAIVVWVQIREFGDHSVGETKSVTFRSKKSDGVACSMSQYTVLLKDKTQLRDFQFMSGSSFFAKRLSR